MRKLRLLMTSQCNRACAGCCNKDWDLDQLPLITAQEAALYPEVYITGGEPLLFTSKLTKLLLNLRDQNPKIKLILYTAWNKGTEEFMKVLPWLDGLTYTLHTQEDVEMFKRLNVLSSLYPHVSYRLNIFKGIDVSNIPINFAWRIKDNIEWIENCPLPEGEVFARLRN